MTNIIPKPTVRNYLLSKNGASILQSSPLPLVNPDMKKPQNVLTQNIRQVWISQKFPAHIAFNLTSLSEKPQNWNRIGFYCWNQFTSIPKLIQVSYKASSQNNWQAWSKLKMQFKTGWQEFQLNSLSLNKVKFLKINILSNYSQNDAQQKDTSVYLNAVMLGYKQDLQQLLADNPSGIMNRQKTYSDYRKLTSTEKELKKMNDKVKILTSQHDIMKKTIDQQSSIILKLQQTIQSLTSHLDNLYTNQSSLQKRLNKYEKQRQQPILPHKVRDFFNDQSQIVNKIEFSNKPYKQKITKQTSQQLQEIPQSKNSSINKKRSKQNNSSTYTTTQKNNGQRSMKRQEVIHLRQNDSLSEYQDPLKEGKSRLDKSDKSSYRPMLEKLTLLLKLKEEKKRQIRSQRKSRRTHQQQRSETDSQSENQIQYQYRH